MNLMLWIFAGGALVCAALTYLDLNGGRGLVISAIIGAAGAYIGGHFLAPALGAQPNAGFSIFALIVAVATAAAALKAADMVYERFEV